MAFTGTAVRKKITDSLYRITGLSLGIGAAGTLSLTEGTGEVKLDGTGWNQYVSSGELGGQVGLDESVTITVEYTDAAATTTEPVAVAKTGATPAAFLATLTNRDAAVSGTMSILLRFH